MKREDNKYIIGLHLYYSGSLVRDVPQLATGLVCTSLVTLTARGSGTVYTYLYPLSIYIGTRNRVKLQFCFI
jgi:hypothetical protein